MKSSPEHVGIRLTDYITQGSARFPFGVSYVASKVIMWCI